MRDTSVKGVRARASIRPALLNQLTLGEVRDELRALRNGQKALRFEALDAKDAAVS